VASSARHPTKDAANDAERCCWLQGIAGGSLGRYAPLVLAPVSPKPNGATTEMATIATSYKSDPSDLASSQHLYTPYSFHCYLIWRCCPPCDDC